MTTTYNFFVEGTPKPQPRPRAAHRVNRYGKVTAGVFDPGSADEWKSAVMHAAHSADIEGRLLEGPVALTLRFRFARPRKHYRTGSSGNTLRLGAPAAHTSRGDADNMAKAVMDALTDAGVWRDDAQVAALHVEKLYEEGRVGCEVTLSPFAEVNLTRVSCS